MMGVMTLALSVFSIIPMALSLVNRKYLARVTIHMLQKYGLRNPDGSFKTEEDTKEEEEQMAEFDHVAFWGTVSKLFHNEEQPDIPIDEDNPRVKGLASAMFVFFIVCIILLIVYLMCSIMLMLGSARGSRWLILPWIVATFLFILAYVTGMALSMWLFGGGLLVFALFAIAFVESLIALYLWCCVVSLFQALGSRDASQASWELKPRLNTSYRGIPTDDK